MWTALPAAAASLLPVRVGARFVFGDHLVAVTPLIRSADGGRVTHPTGLARTCGGSAATDRPRLLDSLGTPIEGNQQMTVDLAADATGSGPITVLLHGITEDARAWEPLIAPLAEDGTVVAVDLRGHGQSPPAQSYDPVSMAEDVHALLERLHLDTADPLIVGHSMGGLVAVAYGARYPVRGVVDVDQPLDLAGFQAQVRELEPMLRGEQFAATIGAVFAAMQGPLSDAEVARLDALRRPDQDVVLGAWAPLLELEPDALDAMVGEVVAGIEAPVLCLHGIDPGPDYPAWLRERIPTAQVEVWADHGHHLHLVDPARFVARIRDFDPRR